MPNIPHKTGESAENPAAVAVPQLPAGECWWLFAGITAGGASPGETGINFQEQESWESVGILSVSTLLGWESVEPLWM